MPATLDELRLFFQEFRTTFDSTGAILPSGPALGRSLAYFIRNNAKADGSPRRILEVGPGTGAVTREIIRSMGPDDRLELVELNDRFVQHLTRKLTVDGEFSSAAKRVQVIHAAVQQLPDAQYDTIVSGLPLNNFTPELVLEIIAKLRRLLAPGGTLSFFEYVAIRRAKAVVCKRPERTRLRRIGQILQELLHKHEIRRDRVLANVPPAWVHHVSFDDNG